MHATQAQQGDKAEGSDQAVGRLFAAGEVTRGPSGEVPPDGAVLLSAIGARGPTRSDVPSAKDVRKIALALEGVSEIEHWGRPAYRTKSRIFAVMRPDGLYLNLDEGRKEFLFEADAKTFAKFMWGSTANVLVQIDRIGGRELEALIREAWERNALPAPVTKRTGRPK